MVFDPITSLSIAEQLSTLLDKKFTLCKYGDFGFIHTLRAVLKKVEVRKYAQYNKAIYIEFLQEKKRKPRCMYLTYESSNPIVIWKDYQQPDDRIFKKSETVGSMVVQSGYTSCSNQYMIDALNSVAAKPFLSLNCDDIIKQPTT